jgi:hypothetical protein
VRGAASKYRLAAHRTPVRAISIAAGFSNRVEKGFELCTVRIVGLKDSGDGRDLSM